MGILFLYLHKLRLEPNSVAKFGIGFLFLAIAFYVFFSCKHYADAAGITSIYIFTFAYFIITFGELFLSPIGLTLMTTLAPKRLVGAMMGTWFLASAYGQYIAGILGSNMSQADDNASNLEKLNSFTDGYYDLAYYALICGLIMIAISPFRKYLMGSVK
jgi:POT family proton-dependent oligopeptide transporter